MFDPSQLLSIYQRMSKLPGGRRVFSKAVGTMAPYTGSIPFVVEDLRAGAAQVTMPDRRKVRNHLQSVHAIALMNLGEVTTGLAMYAGLPRGGRGIITKLSMEYTKKARGPITATCEIEVPTEAGEHDLVVHATLRNSAGIEVAEATAVWRIQVKNAHP